MEAYLQEAEKGTFCSFERGGKVECPLFAEPAHRTLPYFVQLGEDATEAAVGRLGGEAELPEARLVEDDGLVVAGRLCRGHAGSSFQPANSVNSSG